MSARVGGLVERLHAAEIDLADDFRTVGERHAADQDVFHLCHQLAEQCAARAERLRSIAERFGTPLHEPTDKPTIDWLLSSARRALSGLVAHRPETGLVLLRDLRQLYVAAEEIDFYWIMLGQAAQALRDAELLSAVDDMHKQLLTQVKWLKTRAKEAAPQALVAG
ncbi:MAG TPA: hypothetical protein VHB69_06185 [Mycobacteriales bacterium]|nr:hypothetical protein [Mycobacteriales bacterium]